MLATFFKRSKQEMNITINETCSNGLGDQLHMFLQQNSARGTTALQKNIPWSGAKLKESFALF